MNLNYPELNFAGFKICKNCEGTNIIAHLSSKDTAERDAIKKVMRSGKTKYSILKSLATFFIEVTLAGFSLNDISTDNVILYKGKNKNVKAVLKLTGRMSSLTDSFVRPTRSEFHSQESKPAFRGPETFVKTMVVESNSDELFHSNSVKSEIWSLGMVFIHILTGNLPYTTDRAERPFVPQATIDYIKHLTNNPSHAGKVKPEHIKHVVAEDSVRWQNYTLFGSSDINTSGKTHGFMKDHRRCSIRKLLVAGKKEGTILEGDLNLFTDLLVGMLDPLAETRSSVKELAAFFGIDVEALAKLYVKEHAELNPRGGWTIDKDEAVNRAMKAVFSVYNHADEEIRAVALKAGMQMASAFSPNERPTVMFASVLSAVSICASLYDPRFLSHTNADKFAEDYYDGLADVVYLSGRLDSSVVDFFYSVLGVPFKNHGRIFNISAADRQAMLATDGSAFKARSEFFKH